MRAAAAADTGPKPLIALIRAADWMGSEWAEDAIRVGLLEADLEAGRDYELKISSAQGDLATLPSLIDAAIDAKATVIVTLQDATLAGRGAAREVDPDRASTSSPIRLRPVRAPATPTTSPTSPAFTRRASVIRNRPGAWS